jgi:hypothetical protein
MVLAVKIGFEATASDEGAEVLEEVGVVTHSSSAVLGSTGTVLGSSGRSVVSAVLRRSESVVAERLGLKLWQFVVV